MIIGACLEGLVLASFPHNQGEKIVHIADELRNEWPEMRNAATVFKLGLEGIAFGLNLPLKAVSLRSIRD